MRKVWQNRFGDLVASEAREGHDADRTGARKLGVTQGDLSKMENRKRSVGKQMAHRLAKVFNTDYRVFL